MFDFNGTLAVDGKISEEVKEKLFILSDIFSIYILTADTNGNAAENLAGLPVKLETFPSGSANSAKRSFVEKLGQNKTICFGNGRNDYDMLEIAELSIVIAGREGFYTGLMAVSDLCVNNIEDGLDLLLLPNRLIAGLRG